MNHLYVIVKSGWGLTKNGLWDYIIRIDNVLKKDYGVSVL